MLDSIESEDPPATVMDTEELELASTISSSSSQYDNALGGVLEIMSYEDLMTALEEIQDHDQHQSAHQVLSERLNASKAQKIRAFAHTSSCDDDNSEASKELASSVSLPGIMSGHGRDASHDGQRSWSLSLRSTIKHREVYKITLPTSAKLSSLVEFGIHDSLRLPSGYNSHANNSDSICSLTGEESADSPVPTYDGQGCRPGDSEVETETDILPSYTQYSSRQFTLFGNFLHSPFTYAPPSPISPTLENAFSPYDTEGHLSCDQTHCTRCLLLAFAVSRNPSEPHPAASWLAELDSDDFGVRWRRMFSDLRRNYKI